MPGSLVEFKRIFGEWRIRLQRVREIVQPPQWTDHDWLHFSRSLYMLVKRYGSSWSSDAVHYWDVRWELRDGGELICQIEEKEDFNSLVVAQSGGFAEGVESYTWFYGEFNKRGDFLAEPYWVDGNWKEALSMILLPHQMAAGFYLTSSSVPIHTNLLGPAPETNPAEMSMRS
ncbi:MAG: hypothetical protein ACOY3I_03040 [Verrucomicrobiota bacterium]